MCYQAVVTAGGGSQGGVGLVVRDQLEVWIVEYTCFHRPGMVSCEIVSGAHQTLLIEAYLPPYTIDHLLNLEEVLK